MIGDGHIGERRGDADVLHSIDTRLALVENDLERVSGFRKWLLSIIVIFVIQIGSFIYGYAQLQEKVSNINVQEFEKEVSIALTVLADHGTEIQTVRIEQSRMHARTDELYTIIENLRNRIQDRTNDRFYKTDGDKLESRIKRLEDKLLQ